MEMTRVATNLALVDPDEMITYDGTPVAIKDLTPGLRALAGMGHNPNYIAHREQHPGNWPWAPDTCLNASSMTGTWINGGLNLVCPGCGIDCT